MQTFPPLRGVEPSLIDGFIPTAGQSFDLLNWGSVAGAFSSVQLPSLVGFQWDVSQLSAGVLSVAPAFTADFDEDGDVDSHDLAEGGDDFGLASGAMHMQGNGDGDADGDDFLVWQRQLGSPAPAVSAPVPEPATSLLFIVASTGIRCMSGRMRQQLINP